jgi:outer membrane protein assembly factor BamC
LINSKLNKTFKQGASATLLLSLSIALSGCSTISESLGAMSGESKKDRELAANLEIPKNLFNPVRNESGLSEALKQVQQQYELEKKAEIPQFQASGLAIKHNLSERWLEVSNSNSENVWVGLKRFFRSAGFTIEQERQDIGILKTGFTSRNEILPKSEMGTLTSLFNSWRPEVVEGVLDKYTARIETLPSGVVRVFINHTMMVDMDSTFVSEGDSETSWRLRPYSPVMEAEALYQAMVFFGSSSEQAIAQLKVTEKRAEVVDGDEFKSLLFGVDVDQSWAYTQAMIFRAGWDVSKVDVARKSIWVKVPSELQEEESLASALIFWKKDDQVSLPSDVKLVIEQVEKGSVLTPYASDDGQPLTAKQRKFIFESLGFLAI